MGRTQHLAPLVQMLHAPATAVAPAATVVFRDIDYSDLVRVEMLGMRKIGENPVLASVEFEVHDVMGLSLREDASVFQLECDRSRARYGVILLAFRFDPSVTADAFGDLDGAEPAPPVPRGVTNAPAVSRGEEEKRASHSSAPAWDAQDQSQLDVDSDEPVYINVGGHFACLLLDDDAPAQPLRSSFTRQKLSPPMMSAGPVAAKDLAAFYSNSSLSPQPQQQRQQQHGGGGGGRSSRGNSAYPRRFSSQSSSGRSDHSECSDTMHGRGSTTRKSGGAGGGNSGSGSNGGGVTWRGAGKDLPPRAGSSLGGNLAQQFSALGLGGGGNKSSWSSSTGSRKLTRTMSSDGRQAPSSGAFDARLDTQQRWSMPRLRNKQDSESDFGGGGGLKAEVKRVRGWTEGFMRNPTLGGLRARAMAATGGRKSRSRSRSAQREAAAFSADTSSTSLGRGEERYMCSPHYSGANE